MTITFEKNRKKLKINLFRVYARIYASEEKSHRSGAKEAGGRGAPLMRERER